MSLGSNNFSCLRLPSIAATVAGPFGYLVFGVVLGSPVPSSPVATATAMLPSGVITLEKLASSFLVHPWGMRISLSALTVLAQASKPGAFGGSFAVQLSRADSPTSIASRRMSNERPSSARASVTSIRLVRTTATIFHLSWASSSIARFSTSDEVGNQAKYLRPFHPPPCRGPCEGSVPIREGGGLPWRSGSLHPPFLQ